VRNSPQAKSIGFHDLKRFDGWQAFVSWLKKNSNAISFTHKWKTSIAEAYAAQPIVIFCLMMKGFYS
jgi:hypothetical protein